MKEKEFIYVDYSGNGVKTVKIIRLDYSGDETLTAQEKLRLDRIKERLFEFLIEFNEKKNRKELLIEQTKDILDRIMNASSHHSDNPIHREELKDAISKMAELKEQLKHD